MDLFTGAGPGTSTTEDRLRFAYQSMLWHLRAVTMAVGLTARERLLVLAALENSQLAGKSEVPAKSEKAKATL